PVSDRIVGVAKSALSMVMSPTRLRRVYDNEAYIDAGADAFTLPELLSSITTSIWSELDTTGGSFTPRKPMITAFRRALQRDQIDRLIDLSISGGSNSSSQAVASLATMTLRDLKDRVTKSADRSGIDPYSRAHLAEIGQRITKALDAQYTYNAGGGGMAFPSWLFFMREIEQHKLQREIESR
ncbi:MAG TPA: zinc-dependent metalloprotease, partial [Phycisphaerales bacterium]|nr:zinc-dependent metalloprotease [Phycisphaerales bacterium]